MISETISTTPSTSACLSCGNRDAPNLNVSARALAKVMFGVLFLSSIGANAPQATLTFNLGGEGLVSHGKGSNISSSYDRTGSNDTRLTPSFIVLIAWPSTDFTCSFLINLEDHPRNQVRHSPGFEWVAQAPHLHQFSWIGPGFHPKAAAVSPPAARVFHRVAAVASRSWSQGPLAQW